MCMGWGRAIGAPVFPFQRFNLLTFQRVLRAIRFSSAIMDVYAISRTWP
jgi:hypothetical protein